MPRSLSCTRLSRLGGALETVYEDFSRFTEIFGIGGDEYKIRLRRVITVRFEAYRIIPGDGECTVGAGDTERIKRALIFIIIITKKSKHRGIGTARICNSIAGRPIFRAYSF